MCHQDPTVASTNRMTSMFYQESTVNFIYSSCLSKCEINVEEYKEKCIELRQEMSVHEKEY